MSVAEREAFLAEPRVAVLSVASDDDRPPLTVPIFYHYEPGGAVTFFTGNIPGIPRKTRLLQRAGVLSLCVQQDEFPYKYVTVEGTLVSVDQPPAAEQLLTIFRRYMPEPQAQGYAGSLLADPGPGLAVFTVRPDRWLTFDVSKQAG
jgi:nitroimidazol reductase NimA-like FMN-containing flavoprotein (pyridoxamine 5'-phosphate oxidase superfamily)